ncbi:hypothetical protein NIES3806_34900 [Microcystis aeruginosa NIES-3806]|jgi:hypothetical protein|nr:hypothetical protein NIES3806_34900 [Microcystis aeruginosa NIES-3806]
MYKIMDFTLALTIGFKMKNLLIFVAGLWCCALPVQAQTLNRPDFFRRGYEQMQQEINQLQQAPSPEAPSQLLTIKGKSFQWQKFVFQNADFSVWMPEGIQSQETLILETSLGKIPFDLLATHPTNWRFVAAYSQVLDVKLFQDTNSLFAAVKQGIIANTKFKLSEDKPITFQSYLGQEWTIENEQEVNNFRVYLIRGRIYILATRQAKAGAASSAQIVAGFFDSFRLLK